ncbi:DUF6799 domain-containing protein [Hymenobacter siberiensis]|jgi:hypothetical protein|uniref:DUF6799 domain-containing protein n=1 Tax=Hymenobacter siberiensis TaxID=2848396 RepID=UPI001C1E0811|nr:DUF6799 domain-containing protein [Hymenobacter siberiensis]
MKIKNLSFGVFALAFLNIAAAQAQTARPGRVQPKPRVAASAIEGIKDGISMQKGRTVLTELGISNPLTADKKLVNGTIITPAGIVTTPNGTTTQITEGDYVSLTGRVTSRRAIADADSIAKVMVFDAKYPGKRKKMEAEAERKAKDKAKREEEKAKAKAKAEKKKKK